MSRKSNKLFEFTAFSGADFLKEGDDWLSAGELFTMPFSASASITVSDNDQSLSGDARSNESGDDRRGQTADITLDGTSVKVGAKIYAEEYYVLRDERGRSYYLIEIEVAGGSANDRDDFYAFYGDVPNAAAQLTVLGSHNVIGNWLSYKKMSAGLDWSADADGKITIEAEDMMLSGYKTDDVMSASGGEVIKLRGHTGKAELSFGAQSGVYDVEIAYIDDEKGHGSIDVEVNNVVVKTIFLDADNGGNGNHRPSISILTIDNLSLQQGDTLTLRGDGNRREFARIDAIIFTENRPPIADDVTLALDEDAVLTGTLTAVDLDGDALTFSLASNPANGVVSVTEDGAFNYMPYADFNGADSFEYTVTDSAGRATTAKVILDVKAVNDAPVVAFQISTETIEDGAVLNIDLLAGASDLDVGAVLSISNLSALPPGISIASTSLILDPSDAAFQSLALDEVMTLTITYDVIDEVGAGVPQIANITITGVNDGALILGSQITGIVVEDVTPSTTGQLSVADLDSGEDIFQVQDGTAGQFGTFSISADGAWSYDLANSSLAVQSLAARDTVTDIFTVTSLDGTASEEVSITIAGTNDGAIIFATDLSGDVSEDSVFVTTGQITVVDTDAGENEVQSQDITAGQFGTFSITAAGAWTYSLANNTIAVQSLSEGETATDSFFVTSTDGTAGTTVTVTVTGTNDGAQIVGNEVTGDVTEDISTSTVGRLSVVDVDAGEGGFQTQNDIVGQYGAFSITAAGDWSYDLSNKTDAVQNLAAGQVLTDTFTVTSFDGTDSTSVTLTITGTNDGALITGDDRTGGVTEDITDITSGKLAVTDIDAGEAGFEAQVGTVGAFGTFSIDMSGTWTFNLFNSAAATQSLAAGQTAIDSFVVTSVDGTASTTIAVTITGTNDGASISGEDVAGNIIEDSTSAVYGQLSVTDVDTGEDGFQTQSGTVGQFGAFTINSDGAWTYNLANGSSAVQSLAAGQTVIDNFTVTSTDGTANTVITLTVVGANDGALIMGSQVTGDVTEDGALATSGQLSVADVDAGQNAFMTQEMTQGVFGAFSINAAGAWTYDLANTSSAVQNLAAGETASDSFRAISLDGTAGVTVTVTVTGTNDGAVIGGDDVAGTVAEDGVAIVSGQLAVSDIDTGEAGFQTQAATSGVFGSFSIDVAGAWTYDLANGSAATQSLAAGQTATDSFAVVSTDGTATETVTITIVGANDGAIIFASGLGGVAAEDTVFTATGQVTVVDADAGQNGVLAQVETAGQFGAFSIDAAGVWTYALANGSIAVQELPAGATVTDNFAVTSIDGTAGAIVTVTITGTNDGATIFATNLTGAVAEDSTAMTSGQLAIADIDTGESGMQAQTDTVGSYGSFSIDAAGAWSYNLANNSTAVQSLAAGEVARDSFTVKSIDGTAEEIVTIEVRGANDGAIIFAEGLAGAVAEDGVTTVTGKATARDTDNGQSAFQTQAGTVGLYGSFSIDASGAWVYDLANGSATVQALVTGQTVTDTFRIISLDGTAGATVSVTIVGSDDGALILGDQVTGSVVEDVALTANGQLSVADVDAGQDGFRVHDGSVGVFGSFSITTEGVWSYELATSSAAVQALGAGEVAIDSFRIISIDGVAGATVAVTVTGTNDGALITGNQVAGTVLEDSALTTAGQLFVVDADSGEEAFQSQTSTSGQFGEFSITASGGWTYDLANSSYAVQSLAAGQTATDSFTVTSLDGTATETVTITVTGANDGALILGSEVTGSVAEDVSFTATGKLSVGDIDQGQNVFQVQDATAGAYGSFSIDETGRWTYQLSNDSSAVQGLGVGETAIERFSVISADATGGYPVTITITGANDAPTVALQTTLTGEANTVISGVVTGNDVDGDTLVFSAPENTINGAVNVNADGTFIYTPFTDFDGVDSFIFTASDGNGGTASGTVNVAVSPRNIGDLTVATSAVPTAANATLLTIEVSAFSNSDQLNIQFENLPEGAQILLGNTITRDALGVISNTAVTELTSVTGPQQVILLVPKDGSSDGLNIVAQRVDANGTIIAALVEPVDVIYRSTATPAQSVVISSTDQGMFGSGAAPAIEFNEYIALIGGDRVEYIIEDTGMSVSGGGTLTIDGDKAFWDPGTAFDSLAAGEERTVTLKFGVASIVGGGVADRFEVIEAITVTGGAPAPIFTFQGDNGYFDRTTGKVEIAPQDSIQLDHLDDPHSLGKVTIADIKFDLNSDEIVDNTLGFLTDAKTAAEVIETAAQTHRNNVSNEAETTGAKALALTGLAGRLAVLSAAEAAEAAAQAAVDAERAANAGLQDTLDAASVALNNIRGDIAREKAFIGALAAERDSLWFLDPKRIDLDLQIRQADDRKIVAEGLVPAAQLALNVAQDVLNSASAVLTATLQPALDLARTNETNAQAALDNDLAAYTANGYGTITRDQILNTQLAAAGKAAEVVVNLGLAETALGAAKTAADVARTALTTATDIAPDFDISAQLQVDAEVNVQIGAQIDFRLDTGSVDSDIEFSLTTETAYNATTDVLTISPLLVNSQSEAITPFSTISPNIRATVDFLADITADLNVFFDAIATLNGETLFDASPNSNGLSLVETIGGENIFNVLTIDTADSQLPLVIPVPLTFGILEVSSSLLTPLETQGAVAEYDPAFFQEGDFFEVDFTELGQSLFNVFDPGIQFGPEFLAFLENNSISTESFDDALGQVLGGVFDFARGGADTNGDGDVPIFVLDASASTSGELVHFNLIPDDPNVSETGGEFGFFTSYGESEPLVQVNFDVDQFVSFVANVALGNLTPLVVNPVDMSISLNTFLTAVGSPTAVNVALARIFDMGMTQTRGDLDVNVGYEFSQEFSLSVDDVDFSIQFENGERFNFSASAVEEMTFENASRFDADGDGTIDFDLTLDPSGLFSNDTELGVSIGYMLDLLQGSTNFDLNVPLELLGLDKLIAGLASDVAEDIFGVDTPFGELGYDVVEAALGLDLFNSQIGPLFRLQGQVDALSVDIFEDQFEFDLGQTTVTGGIDLFA